MMKLRLLYIRHLMRRQESLQKTIILGKIESNKTKQEDQALLIKGIHSLVFERTEQGY